MSDFVGFHFVPYGDEDENETLFRDFLDRLLARLDVNRVRSSCARERALLMAVGGAFHTPASVDPPGGWRNLQEEVFVRLIAVFGWFGEEAELLKLWMGLYPRLRDFSSADELHSRFLEAVALHKSDPYSRHEAFWKRCGDQGFDSFMRFRGHQPDPFGDVLALIDEAAKTLGDE